MKSLYKSLVDSDGKLHVTFLPVAKQNDGHNCGMYAIAFAADILHGSSPMESQYDVNRMRPHFIECVVNEELEEFPKICKRARVEFHQALKIISM